MRMFRTLGFFIILGLMGVLSGCHVELYHGLNERQANEILLLLLDSGLEAQKKVDKENDGKWMVSVSDEQADYALSLLVANELPRTESNGFDTMYENSGLLPSESQETARFVSALSGELQKTLEADDSVLRARVHMHYQPKNRSLRSREPVAATASVYLKMDPNTGKDSSLSDIDVKALVANSLSHLAAENVIVVRSKSAKSRSRLNPKTRSPSRQVDSRLPQENMVANRVIIILLTTGVLLVIFAVFQIRRKRGGRKVALEVSHGTTS